MATLQNIRNRGGLLVSIIIGLALLAFIVGDALNSGASIFNRSRNQVGEIAGEGISIMDYQNKVSKNEEIIKMMNNISALNDEQQTMLRENTWQQMVMENVMNKQYEELGINVGSEELYDMLLGNNMNPAVRQMFADPRTGAVDINQARTIIKNMLNAPNNSPQKNYWLNMEEQIAASRQQAKYNALITKALYTTDEEAKQVAENSALKSDISYIVKNYSSIDDSTITISESEIKDYYNNHQKLFEQPESRQLVYVNFDIEASSEDFQETQKWVNDMADEFAQTENPAEFVDLSSDQKFDATYFRKDEITNDSLADFLFSGKKGVFGPYLENDSYQISRIASLKMLPDSVRARHILIAPVNNDIMQAKVIADSLANLIRKGADFETLARQNSSDQNSAVNGGDLGWFGQKMMVQPFSDTAFFAKPKEVKVVLTQFGAHVLQVTEQAKPVQKVQIATVAKEVSASAHTTNQIYNNARLFSEGIVNLDNFDKKVAETGVTKRIATINKNDKTIAGMDNARELVRQAYLSSKTGETILNNEGSNIFETGNKYTIAVLTTINEEGIAPLNSNVTSRIKNILIQKKKGEILAKELESAINGSESLLSVATKAGLEVKTAPEVSFNSFQLGGSGIEPKVIATASMLEEGKISTPIAGNQGVYVIMVDHRTQEEVSPENIEQTKQGISQSNMYRSNYQAIGALIKDAEIKDTRYKFY